MPAKRHPVPSAKFRREACLPKRERGIEAALSERFRVSDSRSLYCTFTALLRKCLIMNGAGEGNRTLVIITAAEHRSPRAISPADFLQRRPGDGCLGLALCVIEHNLPPQGGGLWCARQRRGSVFIVPGSRRRRRFINWLRSSIQSSRGFMKSATRSAMVFGDRSSPGPWRGSWTVGI